METVENIYEGVVENSYKCFNRGYANRSGHRWQTREESTSSKTYLDMSKRDVK